MNPTHLRSVSTRWLFACLTLLLAGCAGYHVGGLKPSALRDVRSVSVTNFQNKTLEPRMEVLFANALIKQLQIEGTYPVTREEQADAVITGTLERIDRSPARGLRSDFFQSTEFDLNVLLTVKVTERTSGKVLLSRQIKGSSSFFVSSTSPVTGDVNKDERQAIPMAAEDAAQKLVSYLADGW
jgi:hypothetical protein